METKWYDGKCPSCYKCGWFATGFFPNGEKYEVCRWFGTIFHTETDKTCSAFKTTEGVQGYFERNKDKKKRK